MMERVVGELGLHFIDNSERFPLHNRWLWSSKDSLHLSTNYGLPLFLQGVKRAIDQIVRKPSRGPYIAREVQIET